jgi:hypothetical protein
VKLHMNLFGSARGKPRTSTGSRKAAAGEVSTLRA